MKKLFAVLLVFTLIFAACPADDENNSENTNGNNTDDNSDNNSNETNETAVILCTNNVPNQAAYLEVDGKRILSQDGYGTVGFGETSTFKIEANDEGQEKDIKMSLLAGTVKIPVKQNGNVPVLRNGYEYILTLNFIDGEPFNPDSYSAEINNGTKK